MNSNIPSPAEVSFWYNEIQKHPAFVEELSTYQKSKLAEYCKNQIDSAYKAAIHFFEGTTKANYPEGWPEEKQLQYVIKYNAWSNFAPTVRVLNALGFNWSDKEGFTQITKDQSASQPKTATPAKLIQIAPSVIPELFEGLKDYFSPEEHPKLEALLNGQPIEGQIEFDGNKNKLPELFKRLLYQDEELILGKPDKNEIAFWLSTFFTTSKGELKEGDVYEALTKTSANLSKEKRLCPDLIALTEDQQKARKAANQKKNEPIG